MLDLYDLLATKFLRIFFLEKKYIVPNVQSINPLQPSLHQNSVSFLYLPFQQIVCVFVS